MIIESRFKVAGPTVLQGLDIEADLFLGIPMGVSYFTDGRNEQRDLLKDSDKEQILKAALVSELPIYFTGPGIAYHAE